MDVSVKT